MLHITVISNVMVSIHSGLYSSSPEDGQDWSKTCGGYINVLL